MALRSFTVQATRKGGKVQEWQYEAASAPNALRDGHGCNIPRGSKQRTYVTKRGTQLRAFPTPE